MLSKIVHFVLTITIATALLTMHIFFDSIFQLHSLPKVIVSDWDFKFTSWFWRMLFEYLGTKLAMSTAFHPQTDGQTERMNQILEDMLHIFINYKQDDWDTYLLVAEFAYNSTSNTSIGMTPFKMVYGSDPYTPTTIYKKTPNTVPVFVEFMERINNLTQVAMDNIVLAKKRQEQNVNQSW